MTALAGHTEQYTHFVWIIAALIGAGVLPILAVIYRRARVAHELEEAERVIEEAFREESPRPPVR